MYYEKDLADMREWKSERERLTEERDKWLSMARKYLSLLRDIRLIASFGPDPEVDS